MQSCNTNAILLSLKNLLVLTNTKLHSKSCCYLYLKYTRKIYALLIGWNRVHLSCNTGAKLEHEYKLQIAGTLSKFRLPCLWEMPFSCILLLSNNMISRAKAYLINFQRLQIALAICYGHVKYLVFDKFTRLLTPISLEIMSVLLCAITYRLFRVRNGHFNLSREYQLLTYKTRHINWQGIYYVFTLFILLCKASS